MEGVHPLGAVGVADADADQEARVQSVVDAGGGAAEVVGERARRCRRPARCPGHPAHSTHALNGPAPSQLSISQAWASAWRCPALAAPRALAICWPMRIHEHRAAVGVQGAEVGIGLAADRIQRDRALCRAEPGDRPQHRGEVAAGIGEALVERRADGELVGVSGKPEAKAVWLIARVRNTLLASYDKRRRQEGEVAADAGVGRR